MTVKKMRSYYFCSWLGWLGRTRIFQVRLFLFPSPLYVFKLLSYFSCVNRYHLTIIFFAILLFASCKKNDKPTPSIDFTYSHNIGNAPDTVSFHATVKNVNTVQWYFGDGGSGTGIDVTHIYHHAGYYSVQAIATGEGGQISRFKNVNVSPYSLLKITLISTSLPAFKPDGSPWDNDGTNPDPRLIIYNSSGTEIMNDQIVASNVFSASFNYPSPPQITDFEGSFIVKVYDSDVGAVQDDFIGAITFRPADYMTDTTTVSFPQNFSKNNGQGLSVGVNVLWEN